ncbi:MAG: flagellin N-terminal helical domain-containing protein [Pseudobdellovibrio sp.]
MGLRVNTNTAALNAQFHLRNTNAGVSKVMEHLASGSRINTSSDDAAGLAVSEKMRGQIRGLKQVDRNSQDGISLTQIAEGSLSQISNMLIRLRELGVQAGSDTINDKNRELVNLEYQEVLKEIERISSATEFNGTKLLNGSGRTMDFQINTGNVDSVDRISFDPAQADVGIESLGVAGTHVLDKETAQNSLDLIDQAMARVSELRATFGSIQSRLNTSSENIKNNLESLSAANSRIKDADIAEESSEMAKKNLMLQAGTSVLAQANQQPGQALALLNKG